MSELRKTAMFTAIYTIGVVLNRAVSIIMLPIYTRCLTPSDYGTLELLTITTDIFGMLVGFGLTSAVYKYYYNYDTEKERNMVISTITIMLICLCLIASSAGFYAANPLANLILDNGREGRLYFQLMFAIFFFQAFIEIPMAYIKLRQKPFLFVFISAGKLLLQLSLNIYFVVILKMQIFGVLYSSLISSLLFGTGLTLFTFRTVGLTFNKGLARTLLLFGAPFIFANISSFLLTYSDRYFLKAYAGLAEVGTYSLGYKMGFILWSFAVMPFWNVWGPLRFEIAAKPDSESINQKVFFTYNIIIISIALGMSLFSLDLFRVMSDLEFWGAYKIVPMIMLAYIIQAWTDFANFGILYREKTKYLAYGTSISAVSIILFSFLLIPKYTVYGASLATIIAFFIRFIVINYYSQRLYKLPMQWGRIIMTLVIAASINILSLYFQQESIIFSIIFNGGLFLLFFVLIFMSPVLTMNERREIKKLIRHPIQTYRSGRISIESAT